MAGNPPNVRSYTVYKYGSGQPYECVTLTYCHPHTEWVRIHTHTRTHTHTHTRSTCTRARKAYTQIKPAP